MEYYQNVHKLYLASSFMIAYAHLPSPPPRTISCNLLPSVMHWSLPSSQYLVPGSALLPDLASAKMLAPASTPSTYLFELILSSFFQHLLLSSLHDP